MAHVFHPSQLTTENDEQLAWRPPIPVDSIMGRIWMESTCLLTKKSSSSAISLRSSMKPSIGASNKILG
eukprot:scaffold625_cov324-Pavlova_lutheri.AAC.30